MTTCETTKLVTWSDRYTVGVAKFDSEHQKLIDLVNELYSAMLANKADAVLGKILDGLAAYTQSHFAAEEGLMKKHNYPGFAQHKAEHDKLVAQVVQLQSQFRAGKAKISQEVMSFLQQWLIGHILAVDKKYTGHLNTAGVK